MKLHTLTLILFLICLTSCAQEINIQGSKEPKLTFEVTINGKKYDATEGEELKLDATIKKPSIFIKLSAYKKFDNSSISFNYPRHLSFEFEHGLGFNNWTLSGNNLVVMLFELDAKTSLNSIIEEMLNKFGKKNCSLEDFQKELGHKKWDGKRLKVSLVGVKLTLDFYEIILADNKSRFIAFQDTLEDNGSSTEEYRQGLRIIDSTITYK